MKIVGTTAIRLSTTKKIEYILESSCTDANNQPKIKVIADTAGQDHDKFNISISCAKPALASSLLIMLILKKILEFNDAASRHPLPP